MMASTAQRFSYAPEDPTLPKPWKALVDGKTGYIYFWNTETNVTQYQRPSARRDSSDSAVLLSPSAGASQVVDGDREGNGGGEDRGGTSEMQREVPGDSAFYLDTQSTSLVTDSFTDFKGRLSGDSYRCQHEITVMGVDVPEPFMTFDATGFPISILKEVHNAGFTLPTPIQAQSWPIAMRGHDIVAVAKTGSGKTLGFLFPGFMHIGRSRNNPKMGPTVLVLSPTRELATQIFDEAVKFGKPLKIASTCVYGGAAKGPQLRDIERGVDVVVATPGRLNDILEMRRISVHQVSYLVLDEADRMLDMGFEPQIRKIVEKLPSRRQTLMFTATWPKGVRKIANDLLRKPVQVNIGNVDQLVANKAITQYVEVVSISEKRRRLEQILQSQEPGSKIIIFCSTKKMCDMLVQGLTQNIGAAAIHGDKSQDERDRALLEFRTGRQPVLVATDVAARGLDVKDIRVVINYDFPTGVEGYVHRIGRTGRGGATGVSYTFFCDKDAKYAADLIKVLEGANQQVPSLLKDMASCGSGGYGRFSHSGFGNSHAGRPYYRDISETCFSRFQGNTESPYGMHRGADSGYQQENNSSYDQGSRSPWASDHKTAGERSQNMPCHRSPPRRFSRSRSPTITQADLSP